MDRTDQTANAIVADWNNRTAYRAMADDLDLRDLSEAYAVQRLVQEKLRAARGNVIGRKIALSAKTMQQMCGIDHPIAGGIFENDLRQSGALVSRSGFHHLGVEFEMALRLSQDVAPQGALHTVASVVDLIEGAYPAFELIEDRNADYSDLDVLTLIADNAWCGGAVIGGKIENWKELDLGDVSSCVFQQGMDPEPTNTGAAAPLESLAWVLNHFSERGIALQGGEFIITGSAVRTRFPKVGDQLEYRIADASVQIEIV